MVSRIVVSVGVAVAVLGGGWATLSWHRAEVADATARAAQRAAASRAGNEAELARQVQQLQARLGMMEIQVAATERAAPVAPASEDLLPAAPPVPLDPIAIQAAVEHESGRWKRAFESEREDPSWSRATRGKLIELTRASFPNVPIEDLECREKTCRFAAKFSGGLEESQLFGIKLSGMFPVVHRHRSDVPGREIYFVTEGDAPSSEDG